MHNNLRKCAIFESTHAHYCEPRWQTSVIKLNLSVKKTDSAKTVRFICPCHIYMYCQMFLCVVV